MKNPYPCSHKQKLDRTMEQGRMKYPIGIQTFEQIREEGYIYVDKTDLVHKLVTEGKIYFLSRPRRFGKSLLLSTIRSYFEGRKDLFEGLAMEKLETEWNVYPVFHIDFNGHDFTREKELVDTIEFFVANAERKYGKDENAITTGDRFKVVLAKAHAKTGRRAVVLVDEYDKPLLDVLDTPMEERNRNTLKAFYSIFKAADEHLQFVMLTGVTKFSQVSVFSGFNQPEDISMSLEYETLCGITDGELRKYFGKKIGELARMAKCTVDEMYLRVKDMYDGYHFSESMVDVYNPFSILNAMKSKRLDSYWFKTGSPTYLIRLMEHFNENMDEMVGREYSSEEFIDYRADVERPLPMIYQSGYLTIKGYDDFSNTYRLDFPNNEVKRGFVTMLASSYLKPRESANAWNVRVTRALRMGKTEEFRRLMTSFLASVPYTERRKSDEREKERYFHYTFYLILRMVSVYTVFTEKEQSEGRVDCVIETPEYVYILEFKKDGTAKEAMEQINSKGYAREYDADNRKLYKIGINFSSETGTIDDWMVEERDSIPPLSA